MNSFLLILHLTWRRLYHERLAAMCLCIAVSAALVPLLMILGLKEGTVTMLRNRLASDPVNLEVSLPVSATYTPEEVEKIRALPQVQFCLPGTRSLAVTAWLRRVADGAKQEITLHPTGEGDPLLARFHVAAPKANEIVVSENVAKALQLQVGDTVQVEVARTVNNRRESTVIERRVCGLLPTESDADCQSYAPLNLLVAVEEYIECIRNTPEGPAAGVKLQPVYYGMLVSAPEKLSSTPEYQLRRVMLFDEQRSALPAERGDMPETTRLYYNHGQFFALNKLRPAYALVKRSGGELSLWNPPLQAVVKGGGATPLAICVEPCAPEFGGAAPNIVLRCGDSSLSGRQVLQLSDEVSVAAELVVDENVSPGCLHASAAVAGMLHHALYRRVHWDEQQQAVMLNRRTFSRLRIYARTPEDVPALAATLETMGYRTKANIGAIRRVQILNRQLEILFRLLACIGLIGTAFSLALSLFNSALKQRREYAVLCTLGFSRKALALFPLLESLLLTLLALMGALGIFHLLSGTIGVLFGSAIESGESLCCLSLSLHLQIMGAGAAVALLAAFAAVLTVLRVQPSAAIRDL